jgi:thymidine kinase
MGQVIGQLRETKATWGEREVLKLLEKNTPKEFSIYVECPIQVKRKVSHPDFIVLTNYGYIVLEVKDWAISKVDKYYAHLPNGERLHNPVETARDYALDISNAIRWQHKERNAEEVPRIPYGHAVVLARIGPAIKSQVQKAWGENFVFNLADLQPGYINKRLRETVREDKITPLKQEEMQVVRGVLNPEIIIQDIYLDPDQEKLVMEDASVKETIKEVAPSIPKPSLFTSEFGLSKLTPEESEEAEIPEDNKKILGNPSVRLVRGEMGSGKTLVLKARARRLSREHPDWKILILTFNKALAKDLSRVLKSCRNIEATHLHSFIQTIVSQRNRFEWREVIEQERWIKSKENIYPIIQELGVNFVAAEIKWIQEVMVASRDQYLVIKRVGRGTERLLNVQQRHQVYDILEALQRFLDAQRQFSWETLVIYFLDKLKKSDLVAPQYDAILIDEAQDFAPSWIAIVNHLLKPGGQLFMADDPKQSIFRFFTWRQKGVDVVGKTRRLKVPYRNTLEIFLAANEIIKNDPTVIERLKSDGEYSEPDLRSEVMRPGEKPLLIQARNQDKEIEYILNQIKYFRSTKMITYDQMALIHPSSGRLNLYKKLLKNEGINFYTCNGVKGLEFDVVFFCGMDYFFREGLREDPETISYQKRLIYTCMGRSKQNLLLFHMDDLAKELNVLNAYVNKLTI